MAMIRVCPKCAAANAADAWICACGYEFRGNEPPVYANEEKKPQRPITFPVARRPITFPVVRISTAVTCAFALIAYGMKRNAVRFAVVSPLAFALLVTFLGFLSIIFCVRCLISPTLSIPLKLLSVLLIAVGLLFVGASVIIAGCSTGVLPGFQG